MSRGAAPKRAKRKRRASKANKGLRDRGRTGPIGYESVRATYEIDLAKHLYSRPLFYDSFYSTGTSGPEQDEYRLDGQGVDETPCMQDESSLDSPLPEDTTSEQEEDAQESVKEPDTEHAPSESVRLRFCLVAGIEHVADKPVGDQHVDNHEDKAKPAKSPTETREKIILDQYMLGEEVTPARGYTEEQLLNRMVVLRQGCLDFVDMILEATMSTPGASLQDVQDMITRGDIAVYGSGADAMRRRYASIAAQYSVVEIHDIMQHLEIFIRNIHTYYAGSYSDILRGGLLRRACFIISDGLRSDQWLEYIRRTESHYFWEQIAETS